MTAKVYYNSACPVCRAGIEGQRERMAACGATDVEWVDVHSQPERAAEVGAPLEAIRERLHVKEADGSIGIGVDAFERLWSRTRGQRWLGVLARVPGLRQLGQFAYNVFAHWLYRRNRAKGRW